MFRTPQFQWMRLFLPAGLLIVPGCGPGDRLPLYSSAGSVVVDGQPAQGVEVRLHPANRFGDPDALRPFATTETDGSFDLGTYEAGDGAPAGSYRATLFWPDRPPGPDHPNDRLEGAYADPETSDFRVTISESANTIPPFQAQTSPTRRTPNP